MRVLRLGIIFVALGACDGDDGDQPFTDVGGALALESCGYTITTRLGAEPPRIAGDKLGADPTPRLVHLGIVGDPRTSIVAQWRTVDETTTASVVRYGVGEGLSARQLTKTVNGIQFGYKATGTQIHRVHQAHLCDLEPGTTYSYQVGANDHFSAVYTFRTAPDMTANPDAEVVLGFVGDSRGGYDVWAQVVAQLQQRAPDLILYSGDAVTIGLSQPEWEEFLGVAEPLFATVPVVLTNGNHEANAVNFFSQFAMPGDQATFGFDYGDARVVVANDTPENEADVTTTIPAAIDAELTANASAPWKLLMHHKPMWSSGTRHGSNLALQAAWGPIVDKHRVDLVLNGHEHQFEVSKPLNGGVVQPSSATGTVYMVSGGAGAELYGFGTPGLWSDYIETTHGASLLRVRRNTLIVESFRADGTMIPQSFTKAKP